LADKKENLLCISKSTTMRQLIFFVFIVFISSCSNRKWTEADRKKFITDCTAAAQKSALADKATSYCECMLPVMEKKFPTIGEANKVTEADMRNPDMQAAATKCLQ
jgi:hypothetical protein